jgi:hypothetical protein
MSSGVFQSVAIRCNISEDIRHCYRRENIPEVSVLQPYKVLQVSLKQAEWKAPIPLSKAELKIWQMIRKHNSEEILKKWLYPSFNCNKVLGYPGFKLKKMLYYDWRIYIYS